MRLVAVSVVKNEADIIEAFVRHTLEWVDHHLIFDHRSTDGTLQILAALKTEGLPVTLFCDDSSEHLQQARSNYLTRLAVDLHGADWVFPLDADEILNGPDRPALERTLEQLGREQPACLHLIDYYPTEEDDPSIVNPVIRLRYCRSSPSHTKKIFIPRNLCSDTGTSAGKGSHALYRGNEALANRPLPDEFFLAHLALRSPEHQILRVIRAELQRQARGKAGAGLDVHYRLGYQLLAESPELFYSTACFSAVSERRLFPINYCGGPLQHTINTPVGVRLARSLLPYLDQLAIGYGQLIDELFSTDSPPVKQESSIRELKLADIPPFHSAGSAIAFQGFIAVRGWSNREGPIPEAFLPPFHWGCSPFTELIVHSDQAAQFSFRAECLTYSENQKIIIELNGRQLFLHTFGRVNQMEVLHYQLPLCEGENLLSLNYTECLVTTHDPRRLAVIFLSLRVVPTAKP